jgi:butyrate kinase
VKGAEDMKNRHFLVINPGSTSTKIALFRGSDPWTLEETARQELDISRETAEAIPEPMDQLEFRSRQIEDFLEKEGPEKLDAVAGRGGLTRPLEAGSYAINDRLIDDLKSCRYGNHASNLGALIAKKIGEAHSIPSLIADPVGVDQFEPAARYSGWPALERKSQLHALNMRSVAREAARELGGGFEQFNFIIAHLGGGISIAPMQKGRMIDVNHAMDGGPFSPQRVGALPVTGLIELAFSGSFASARQMIGEMTRRGGMFSYLGTDDGREVRRRIAEGDKKAEEVYHAMAYQISKEIGAMAAVLKGKVDAVILTGGLPHPPLSEWIEEYCSWIAPVRIHAGERELLALAQAAARHVCEGEALLEY